MIGDGIQVSVLAVMGEKVRIGIEAPRSVPVFRQEVWLEIQRDRAAEDGSGAPEGDAKAVTEALDRLKTDEP
jgi:carbon storage regulator